MSTYLKIGKAGNPFRWQTYNRGRLDILSPSMLRDRLGMGEVMEFTDEGLTNDEGAIKMTGKN